MNQLIFFIFLLGASWFFWLFLRRYELKPLWLMLSAWMVGLGVPFLNLSEIEKPMTAQYWILVVASLLVFAAVHYFSLLYLKRKTGWFGAKLLDRSETSAQKLRPVIYALFLASLAGLFMFYRIAGNFSLFASDPDVFRFAADDQVPGILNYMAQLARIYIPLSFFLIFLQGFSFRKHWDIGLISLIGIMSIILFTSRTQIFFVDLWVMALYMLMRRPTLKQAMKFYPVFLLISILVLAAVPMFRQYKSYGTTDYLAGITAINSSGYNPIGKALLPIYVGVSFNQQALLHAQQYYQTHPVQMGRVALDPFTNILGLDNLKSDYDLCNIFQCWWNTGTYLFPFVQDFGNAGFFIGPLIIAFLSALLWQYWKANPNFLSINLYAYACFFIVMTIYLSFTVRAEMYMDLALLFLVYLFVSPKIK